MAATKQMAYAPVGHDEAEADDRAPSSGESRRARVAALLAALVIVLVLALGRLPSSSGGSGAQQQQAGTEVGGSCPGGPRTAEGVPRELGGTIPLIFDSDFGSFMDDSFALAFALGSPEISLQLAIAVGGPGDNPVRRARALGRHLNQAGRGHIQLASGPSASGPDIGALENWGSSYALRDHPGGYTDDAAAAAAELVRQHAAEGRQVVWAILGAHTAAADFARRFPELQQHVRVVAMGLSVCGGVTMPWGPTTPWPGTNEKQNVPAANAVIRAPWGGGPVVFAPVKASSSIVLSGPDYAKLLEASTDAESSPGLATLEER
jgi:inosine-uridine nucleoside N-ribohydrolase